MEIHRVIEERQSTGVVSNNVGTAGREIKREDPPPEGPGDVKCCSRSGQCIDNKVPRTRVSTHKVRHDPRGRDPVETVVTILHRSRALGGEIPEGRRLEDVVAEGIPSIQARIQVALGERDSTHVWGSPRHTPYLEAATGGERKCSSHLA